MSKPDRRPDPRRQRPDRNKQSTRPIPKPANNESADTSSSYAGERLAKRLARAGLCSRREAERWIESGRVKVNGARIVSPALNVTEQDKILVDGKPLGQPEPPRLWRFYKKAGLVTTNRDPAGRETVFDVLPEDLPRVMTVGRLDYNTEGLLLLTNDGDLARFMELPSTGLARRYRVRVHGTVREAQLEALKSGLTVAGVNYGPVDATLDRQVRGNAWLSMTLREGKNREIRKLCQHLGWEVNRLIRLSYGPFMLGQMTPGEVSEIPTRVLKDQFGKHIQFADDASASKDGAKAKARPTSGKTRTRQDRNSDRNRVGSGKSDRGKTAATDRNKSPRRGSGKPSGKPDAHRRRRP